MAPSPGAAAAVARARAAGLGVRVIAVDHAVGDRLSWLLDARRLADAVGGIAAVAPLPRHIDRATPTTGFDDVRTVALARLVIGDVPSVQVDWARYGPKLAQVALTVGADDLDGVSPVDDAGARPAPRRRRGGAPQHRVGRSHARRARRPLGAAVAMSARVRVSAVSFLNARPLVDGLERLPALFDVEYDLPSTCAARLHAGDVDLGLIPAVEYLDGDYRLVPDVAIGSDGPILSVAIFTARPIERIARLAVDTSSRTSVALCRILCARHWGIAPAFVPAPPDLREMLALADAALVIGDPALAIDPAQAGVEKIDLGAGVA